MSLLSCQFDAWTLFKLSIFQMHVEPNWPLRSQEFCYFGYFWHEIWGSRQRWPKNVLLSWYCNHISWFSLQGDGGSTPASPQPHWPKNLLISSPGKIPPSRLLPPKLNFPPLKTFFIFSCYNPLKTLFLVITPVSSLFYSNFILFIYTGHTNFDFIGYSFEKGWNGQNHSFSGFHHPIKKSPLINFLLPPLSEISPPHPLNTI